MITHAPCEPSGEDHLRDAERVQLVRVGAADQRYRLLVVQLEDLDVVEYVADVRIRPERPDLGGAHEALKVDEELPAAGIERGEGRRRKVGPS